MDPKKRRGQEEACEDDIDQLKRTYRTMDSLSRLSFFLAVGVASMIWISNGIEELFIIAASNLYMACGDKMIGKVLPEPIGEVFYFSGRYLMRGRI